MFPALSLALLLVTFLVIRQGLFQINTNPKSVLCFHPVRVTGLCSFRPLQRPLFRSCLSDRLLPPIWQLALARGAILFSLLLPGPPFHLPGVPILTIPATALRCCSVSSIVGPTISVRNK